MPGRISAEPGRQLGRLGQALFGYLISSVHVCACGYWRVKLESATKEEILEFLVSRQGDPEVAIHPFLHPHPLTTQRSSGSAAQTFGGVGDSITEPTLPPTHPPSQRCRMAMGCACNRCALATRNCPESRVRTALPQLRMTVPTLTAPGHMRLGYTSHRADARSCLLAGSVRRLCTFPRITARPHFSSQYPTGHNPPPPSPLVTISKAVLTLRAPPCSSSASTSSSRYS